MNGTHSPFRFVHWIFAGLVVAGSLIGCTEKPAEVRLPNSNSINIKLTTAWPTTDIQAAFRAVFPNLPLDSIKVRSCPCDPALINIKLPRNWLIEGHSGKMNVKSDTDGATGGEDIPLPGGAITGFNHLISTFDDSPFNNGVEGPNELKLYNTIDLKGKNPQQAIKVALFDSGLNDLHIHPYLYTTTYMCREGGKYDPGLSSKRGWNFVSDSYSNTWDTSKVNHGSRVAYLLAKQFNGSAASPRIVPMRVLDSENKGDLFGLLCAMETARINNIKVFNMSLGYYGAEDPLLKSYVEKAVTENIWIMTAAGNRPPRQANAPDTVNRHMASMSPKFYPAYFASEFPNVLPVTTVLPGDEIKTSARQNYGSETVYGVLADQEQNDEGRFLLAPGDQTSNQTDLYIFGTSYATPILAGRVARILAENPAFRPGSLPEQMQQGLRGSQVKGNRFFRSAPPAN